LICMFAGTALLAAAAFAALLPAIGLVLVDIRRLVNIWLPWCGYQD
jgi:hypothetical protein